MTIRLREFFTHFKGEPHQLAAVELLQSQLPPELLENDAEWVQTFRVAPKPKPSPFPAADPSTWDVVVDLAQKAGAKYPELVAAQWALESNWGKTTTGLNNFFGLKGNGSKVTTREFINGKWVTIKDSFINFPTLEASVNYLVERWYKDFKQFKGVNNAANRNAAAQQLVKQGYATDPEYATKLISVMDGRQPPQAATPKPATDYGNTLTVPWYAQLDSSTDQGRRMCFSSSCAMLLEYLKPGTLKGPNGDDQYLKRVQQYGDTTNPDAQLAALKSYGIDATFTKKASFKTLEQQIKAGVPIPCGYLHRGPVSQPSGGGHWLCVVGYTPTQLIVHDPFGEADLVSGTTLNKPARYCKYSRKNFGPRWMVEGTGTGWAIIAKRP